MPDTLREIMATAKGSSYGAAAAAVESRVMLPARVQINGEILDWSDHDGTGLGERSGHIDDACLRQFARLADAPPDRFVTFARHYGVLYLGKGGFPVHPDDLRRRVDHDHPPWIGPCVGGQPIEDFSVWYQEPLEGWRAWSRYVRAVYVLCHELRQGERLVVPEVHLSRLGVDIGPKDRDVMINAYLEPTSDGELQMSDLGWTIYSRLWPRRLCRELQRCQTVEAQWDCLVQDVGVRLLRQAEFEIRLGGSWAAPRITLDRPFLDRIAMVWRVHHALSTIIGQLLASASGRANQHQCVDCRLPYPVQRRRENGRCPECRMKARSASVQRSKARQRARALTSTPVTVP
jgi:hypothetical protein